LDASPAPHDRGSVVASILSGIRVTPTVPGIFDENECDKLAFKFNPRITALADAVQELQNQGVIR
jgi:hypothetical protein